jgi:hypothetical protein
LLIALDREFTFTFGGCTIIRGLDGSYLSQAGLKMQDKINIVYTDMPLALGRNLTRISRYVEFLSSAAYDAVPVPCQQVARRDNPTLFIYR